MRCFLDWIALALSSSEECQCSSWSNPGCVVSAYHPATYAWDNATKKICYLHSDRKSNKAPDTAGVVGCDTGRANQQPHAPPPHAPPAARYCRPRVMAVRKGHYKLHMFTKGGGRPPIHRTDWPPASVTVKSGCTLTQAEGCVYESKADLVVAQTRIGCWSSR